MKNMMVFVFVGASIGSTLAYSQETSSEPRYQLIETPKGVVRLNRDTGRVSLCSATNSGMVCKVTAEERQVWEAEVQELSTKVAKLEDQINAVSAEKKIKAPTLENEQPTSDLDPNEEKQLDKALRVTENVMRRFITVLKDIKKDFETN